VFYCSIGDVAMFSGESLAESCIISALAAYEAAAKVYPCRVRPRSVPNALI
jgi:hypothetical protein